MVRQLHSFWWLFSLSLLIFLGGTASSQAEESIKFVCGALDQSGRIDTSVPMVAGVATQVTCELTSAQNQQTIPVMLVGKRVTGQELPVVSVAHLNLNEGIEQVSLIFPAVFQPGTYQYTFSAINTSNQQPVASEAGATGDIVGEGQPKIVVATLDKASYAWQDEFTVQYTLDIPKGYLAEKEDLTLQVAMFDEQGGECWVADPALKPRQASGSFSLKFPEARGCANTLVFTLSDIKKEVLDEYRLAVPIDMADNVRNSSSMTPGDSDEKMNMKSILALAFVGVLLLLIVSFWFLKRRV